MVLWVADQDPKDPILKSPEEIRIFLRFLYGEGKKGLLAKKMRGLSAWLS